MNPAIRVQISVGPKICLFLHYAVIFVCFSNFMRRSIGHHISLSKRGWVRILYCMNELFLFLHENKKKCTRSGNFRIDINPAHFKILSTQELKHGNVCKSILKTLLQNYRLELAARIQTYIDHGRRRFICDTLWSVRNRIFSVQIAMVPLIASETFSRVIDSSFVSV